MDSDRIPSSEDALPSTPQPLVFSDDAKQPSSPPSSPPGFPWEYESTPKAVPQPPQKSAFSLLGKRKALSSISDNARPPKKQAVAKKTSENRPLTQMQISLGQEVQKKCKTCGMEYILSSTEDRKLHDRYHKQNTEGYDVGKEFVRSAPEGTVFKRLTNGDVICVVDYHDKPTRKKKSQTVLDIVQRELGAVEIDEDGIWDAKKQKGQEPMYRSYLFLRGTKCVGYLLIEKIHEAREVVPPNGLVQSADVESEPSGSKADSAVSILKKRRQAATERMQEADASPIELSKTAHKASLGVSRIWTSSTHRRQNIATAVLDAALRHEMQCARPDSVPTDSGLDSKAPGDELIDKDQVAFSQPTDSGARLARRWFGKTYGWKVYVD